MKKAKRVVSVLVVAILSCFCLLGCNLAKKQSDENKRYDVTIRIANNFGQTWEFPPNVSELRYEFEYTGEEMRFYVDAYKLSDHPRWGEYWLEPKGEGADVFYKTMTYRAPGDKNISYTGPIKEKGEYCICVEAGSTSRLWNFRAVYLTVKIS